MKTKLTLIKNDDDFTLLPHKNTFEKSILKNSNIKTINQIRGHMKGHYSYKQDMASEIKLKRDKQAQKLKFKNKQLRTALESAGIMAHNLKSPVMALELLLNNDTVNDSSKSLIKMALNKITKTIGDIQLLDTAYSAALDKKNINYKIDINSFIQECFDEVTHIYQKDKNVNFELNIPHEAVYAKLNPELFKDTFYNIVKNAYEAIEYKGAISLLVLCKHKSIEIRVSDSGKGMPEHVLKNLGNKRFTSGKKGGSGIGLYHVKKVLRQIDGRLEVKSEQNIGTQVSVFLPRADYFSVIEGEQLLK